LDKRRNKYFIKIFIHGDPKYLPLLPDKLLFCNGKELLSNISKYIFYTGYVCNPMQKQHRKKDGKIYVSTGLNKEENIHILKNITKIADEFTDKTFIFIQGSLNKLEPIVNKNKILVNFIPELHKKLETCELFITYGGYNSTMEVLKSKCPAIIIPRINGDKKEQLIRVKVLKKYNYFKVGIPSTNNFLVKCIKEILTNNNFPNKCEMNLNGAENTSTELRRIYSKLT